jgi:hypothetical protein
VGSIYKSWDEAKVQIQVLFSDGKTVIAKAPYGTSGVQVKHFRAPEDLKGKGEGWLKNILQDQGAVIIEEYLNKIYDLSIQIEVLEDRVKVLDVRRFLTGRQREYRGAFLGSKLNGFSPQDLRFVHQAIGMWRPFVLNLGRSLRSHGYLGSAGMDGLIWRDVQGGLRLKPLVELNPRWTMGRVALELEKHLNPGAEGLWCFLSLRDLKKLGFEDARQFATIQRQLFPVQMLNTEGGKGRIQRGVIFTNDPALALEVLTVLVVLPQTEMAAWIQKYAPIFQGK